jgi:hypothetical protein
LSQLTGALFLAAGGISADEMIPPMMIAFADHLADCSLPSELPPSTGFSRGSVIAS